MDELIKYINSSNIESNEEMLKVIDPDKEGAIMLSQKTSI